MSPEAAEVFIRCHSPGAEGDDDARIRKAVKMAGKNESLKGMLEEQTRFDERGMAAVKSIALPVDLVDKVKALRPPEEEGFDLKSALRQPPFLAACFALLFLLGWGVMFAVNRLDSFPGRENVKGLVAVNENMSGMEMELKTGEVGKLADWLFSRYGFEDFYVPTQFAGHKSMGARVFRHAGTPVAQLVVEENDMLFYMFRGGPLGVKLSGDDRWHVFEQEGWAAAIQQHGEHCFMIAFRGDKEAMERFLATKDR